MLAILLGKKKNLLAKFSKSVLLARRAGIHKVFTQGN
jgi:hypothetical protein